MSCRCGSTNNTTSTTSSAGSSFWPEFVNLPATAVNNTVAAAATAVNGTNALGSRNGCCQRQMNGGAANTASASNGSGGCRCGGCGALR